MKITGKKRQKIDMDNNNPSTSSGQAGSGQGSNFFSGFLIGVLVGAAVVFLLGTKKGKKLLKAISEDGIEDIYNLLDEANQPTPALRPASKASTYAKAMADKPEEQREEFLQKREFAIKEKAIEEKPKARRFFRGISRRVN